MSEVKQAQIKTVTIREASGGSIAVNGTVEPGVARMLMLANDCGYLLRVLRVTPKDDGGADVELMFVPTAITADVAYSSRTGEFSLEGK